MPVEWFTPTAGVSPGHQDKLLINLHGGGFWEGSGVASHVEAVPIACRTNIPVLSIDYRMAPEHKFPAASDDVVAVYQALLKNYTPNNIGFFGCSAGAVLITQAIARFLQEEIPLPAAVGLSCAGAYYWGEGDSGHIAEAMGNYNNIRPQESAYFSEVASDNRQAFPAYSCETLAAFPPSLLISSVRDFALSSVVHTHRQLVEADVDAHLHVWEGVEHAFMHNPELEASQQALRVMAAFFGKLLG